MKRNSTIKIIRAIDETTFEEEVQNYINKFDCRDNVLVTYSMAGRNQDIYVAFITAYKFPQGS